jgi:multiple sugar transport system permease protein
MNKKENIKAFLFILPSLIGFLMFFILPFLFSLKYAMTSNGLHGSFVGLANFQKLFASEPFILAVKNTFIFMAFGIPINILLPLLMACLLKYARGQKLLATIFMSPLVIPSACIAFLFQSFFASNGLLSKIMAVNTNWLQTDYSMLIAIAIYVWKNMGYNLVLIMAGLSDIPTQYYEWASIEGIGKIQGFVKITLVYLMPSLFIVLVMSFINSFKVFREIYMLSGSYPNEKLYMLQHYMNNQFAALNYQNLTAASFTITLVITIIVVIFFIVDKKSEFGE